MFKTVILVFLLSVLLPVQPVNADSIPQYFAGMLAGYGFIIPHSIHIEPVSHTNPYGIELSAGEFHGSEYSRQVFNAYWYSGVQVAWFNYQNPQALGSSFTITAFAEPVVFLNEKIILTVRGGAGFSYQTRIYDEELNPQNQFFSTRISFPLYVGVRTRYLINDNIFVLLACNYNHISNGGIRQPNYGMNFPTLSAGIEYYLSSWQPPPKIINPENRLQGGNMSFTIEALCALRVIDATDLFPEKKTISAGLHSWVSKPLTRMYSLNGGAEIIVDGYLKEINRRSGSYPGYTRLAITAGQTFRFGRVLFTQHAGYYLWSPVKAPAMIYEKYELTYRFRSGLATGVFIRAYLYEAEMMGITLCFSSGGTR